MFKWENTTVVRSNKKKKIVGSHGTSTNLLSQISLKTQGSSSKLSANQLTLDKKNQWYFKLVGRQVKSKRYLTKR